ncbi:SSI family serine proteinase inhibitor [Streptomyces zingiberis]|uniref:Subtilisin inhibitor domain-containing protein n=1 Tax=Streptomyces zingiberis TaxID=2053010 RepID=A0ABX1BN75_9ACTN|nr:SSI family serine proteinase inhibitor [Streptomyces zingiberis]NJP99160.1 hypothetical protein [Streptomyces zingiberis]
MPFRRLTAAVFCAAALLATAPAAGAAPSPPPVPLPAPAGAPAGEDRLVVSVSDARPGAGADGGGAGETGDGAWGRAPERSYRLECHPAGGTHPSAPDACGRLDELGRDGGDPFARVPAGTQCTMLHGGPETARVTGSWHGRPVNARYNREGGCEIARWERLGPVLPGAGPEVGPVTGATAAGAGRDTTPAAGTGR